MRLSVADIHRKQRRLTGDLAPLPHDKGYVLPINIDAVVRILGLYTFNFVALVYFFIAIVVLSTILVRRISDHNICLQYKACLHVFFRMHKHECLFTKCLRVLRLLFAPWTR